MAQKTSRVLQPRTGRVARTTRLGALIVSAPAPAIPALGVFCLALALLDAIRAIRLQGVRLKGARARYGPALIQVLHYALDCVILSPGFTRRASPPRQTRLARTETALRSATFLTRSSLIAMRCWSGVSFPPFFVTARDRQTFSRRTCYS